MAVACKVLPPCRLVNVLVTGAEVVVWEDTGASRNIALPAIGALNATLAVILVVGWARVLGHGGGRQRGYRATLTQEIGKIYYTGAEAS